MLPKRHRRMTETRKALSQVSHTSGSGETERDFSFDAPGGCGKTFILSTIRYDGKIAIATAGDGWQQHYLLT